MNEQPTMLWKNTRVSKTGVVFSIYCGRNPTEQAKMEVRKQIIKFLENQAIEGQMMVTVAVSSALDKEGQ
jgi:hypothetical protein